MPEVTEAQAEQQSFATGFAKVSGTAPQTTTAAPSVDQPAQTTTAEPAKPAAPAVPAAPAKDPWEGVHPQVKTTLETISGRLGSLDKFEHRLKGVEGRVGALYQARQTAQKVTQAGGAAPSPEQIQAASATGEKWKALLEAFPDFKDGLEERFAQLDAALKQQKPFDPDGFRKEVVGGVNELVSNNAREVREFAKLDRKHEDWEDTINTPQFSEWAFSNGPTATEQAQWILLKKDSPDQADEFFQGFAQRYPQWWVEKGSHMASDKAKDAIALLDNYESNKQAVLAKEKQKEKNVQRLEGAITPQGAGAPPGQPPQDEEAAFRKGVKRVLGR